jgi:hypothetical protein
MRWLVRLVVRRWVMILAGLALFAVLHAAGVRAAEPCTVVVVASPAVDPSIVPSTAPCAVVLSDADRAALDAIASSDLDTRTVVVYGFGLLIFLGAVTAVSVGLRR